MHGFVWQTLFVSSEHINFSKRFICISIKDLVHNIHHTKFTIVHLYYKHVIWALS